MTFLDFSSRPYNTPTSSRQSGVHLPMKRKASSDLEDAIIPALKKCAKGFTNEKSRPCQLLHILSQYGLLVAIASSLFPRDLYALAATSKATYRAIFVCSTSRTNLLGKMACDGRGMALRNQHHQLVSTLERPNSCRAWFECGSKSSRVATRPCSECSHITCDECRIHCVYQTVYENPSAEDELQNLSGFALLSSLEMGILTPSHLGLDNSANRPQQLCVGIDVPYHDMGFLEAPLTSNIYMSHESIGDIIHFDLGTGPLGLTDEFYNSYDFSANRPSPVIQPFWEITEARKRWFCNECASKWRIDGGCRNERFHCHCTLKERFLDRWLCLPCYQREMKEMESTVVPSKAESGGSTCTSCKQRASKDILSRICLWCLGYCEEPTWRPAT
jgi:hypothetical protein